MSKLYIYDMHPQNISGSFLINDRFEDQSGHYLHYLENIEGISNLQGGAYVFGRFCEAVLRSLGDLKKKKIPVKNSCNYLQKLIKNIFCDIKHGLTMTSYF